MIRSISLILFVYFTSAFAVNCLGVCVSVCVFSSWLPRSPSHFPLAFSLSSIISTTDELFNEFDSKQCLNTSVMAVLTMTPSLGPNLCYWPAEDELSAGEKNQRVWNGKWYTTVAYRGNLYYKLPRCTVAEPQIALSLCVWVCVCLCIHSVYMCVFVCGMCITCSVFSGPV